MCKTYLWPSTTFNRSICKDSLKRTDYIVKSTYACEAGIRIREKISLERINSISSFDAVYP